MWEHQRADGGIFDSRKEAFSLGRVIGVAVEVAAAAGVVVAQAWGEDEWADDGNG